MRAVVVLFLVYALLSFSDQQCLASDTLNAGEKIKANETILVSAGKQFELGFFSRTTGSYLGIWYYQQEESEPQTVVWVANRDNPIAKDSTGVFQIAKDGNAQVVDTFGKRYWSSKLEKYTSFISRRRVKLKLVDSGNLVLLDKYSGSYLWQSFNHPTHTFLPGMKMDDKSELTCWRYSDDPGSGNFTFKLSQTMDKRLVILNRDQLYWESERRGLPTDFIEPGTSPDDITPEVYSFLFKLTTRNGSSLTIHENKRVMINSTGVVQLVLRHDFPGDLVPWHQPKTKCSIYNTCGKFASCNDNNRVCKCLPGFDNPIQNGDNIGGSGSLQDLGCARKSTSPCGRDTTTFLNLVMMKIGNPDIQVVAANQSECQNTCLDKCPECQAYFYADRPIRRSDIISPSTCWIWTQDLPTLQEDYAYGRNLSVRVHKSDIATTPKTCEPCGTNIVPYPLSTGPSCGDPMYFKFTCDNSTDQLNFIPTINQSYRVTLIKADARKVFIQVIREESFNRYCDESNPKDENLQISSPFDKIDDNRCSGEVEVIWQPPSEGPTCNESIDCEGWPHSTCKAAGEGNRCLCDANYYWLAW